MFSGHDWGSMVVWELGRLHPDRVGAIYNMSVPYSQAPGPPTQIFEHLFEGKFFYMLYFQEVGPAEAEFEADPRRWVRTMLYSASGEGMANPNPALDRHAAARDAVPRHFDAGPRHAAGVVDRGGRRRVRRRARTRRPVRPGQLLPQHGRQLGAFQGHCAVGLRHARRLHHRLARPGQPHDAGRGQGHGRSAARLPRRNHGRRGRATGCSRSSPAATNAALLAFLASL